MSGRSDLVLRSALAMAGVDLRVHDAKADRERMEWLERQGHALTWIDGERVAIRGDDGREFRGESWRECIDRARRSDRRRAAG